MAQVQVKILHREFNNKAMTTVHQILGRFEAARHTKNLRVCVERKFATVVSAVRCNNNSISVQTFLFELWKLGICEVLTGSTTSTPV